MQRKSIKGSEKIVTITPQLLSPVQLHSFQYCRCLLLLSSTAIDGIYATCITWQNTKRESQHAEDMNPQDCGGEEKKDANVSYADEDCGFIRHKIHAELEAKRGLKLHIRDRDSPIAEVGDNIVDAIERSRRTLIILSKAYLKHKWCIFEMKFADIKASKTGEKVLCVLLLEDVPYKDLPLQTMRIIRDRQHFEYPGDENLQDCFWDRLQAALVD